MEVVGKEERAAAAQTIINLVSLLLTNALRKKATEIRLDPDQEGVVVSYVIDGEPVSELAPPMDMCVGVVARFKLLSGLDPRKHDAEQNGQFPFKDEISGVVTFRVAVLQTGLGEQVVIRCPAFG